MVCSRQHENHPISSLLVPTSIEVKGLIVHFSAYFKVKVYWSQGSFMKKCLDLTSKVKIFQYGGGNTPLLPS